MENNKKPLITIIIPVYNEEHYLKEGIESVLKQDYENLEILIVDDGSTDNSANILDSFARRDNRIKVIHKENSGVSNSRNLALKEAKGEYICFMDADDYITKDYVSYLYKLIEEKKTEISLVPMPKKFKGSEKPNLEINTSSDKIEIWTGKKATAEMLYYRVKESSWCKLIKIDLIKRNNIKFNPDLKCGEGFNFCTECLQMANKVAVGNKTIYFYRVDNINSAMTRFNMDRIKNGVKAIQLIDKNLKVRDEELVKACHYAYWHTHCDFLNTIIGCKVEKKYSKEYKEIKQICRKQALCVLSAPISVKEKIKGILYFINPYITAKLINHFRIRKFTIEEK